MIARWVTICLWSLVYQPWQFYMMRIIVFIDYGRETVIGAGLLLDGLIITLRQEALIQ
jgi:hypothetical protein